MTYNLRAFKAAFLQTLPVTAGFLLLGAAYGMLMHSNGYGGFWPVLTSVLVFAGSMQFVAIALLVSAFNPLQAFLLCLMVNARHLFYGISMLEKYRDMGRLRPFLIFTLCDETFCLVSSVKPPEDVDAKGFYFFISLLDYAYWIVGTLLGSLFGNVAASATEGMDFVLTALFVVLFAEQWKSAPNRLPGGVGVVCAVAGLLLFGQDNMVIPAMLLIIAVLWGGRGKICA